MKLHSQSTYAHKNPEHIWSFSIIQSVFLTLNQKCWQDTFYLVIFIVLAFFRRWGTCLPYFFIIALAKCGAMKGKKRTPNFLSKNSSFFRRWKVCCKKSPNKERDMDDDDDLALNEFSARQVKQGSCGCCNGDRGSPNKTFPSFSYPRKSNPFSLTMCDRYKCHLLQAFKSYHRSVNSNMFSLQHNYYDFITNVNTRGTGVSNYRYNTNALVK